MSIKAGETVTISTDSYGDVKVWNHKDKELHFTWKRNGREDNGWLNPSTGMVSNVPQNLLKELVEKL